MSVPWELYNEALIHAPGTRFTYKRRLQYVSFRKDSNMSREYVVRVVQTKTAREGTRWEDRDFVPVNEGGAVSVEFLRGLKEAGIIDLHVPATDEVWDRATDQGDGLTIICFDLLCPIDRKSDGWLDDITKVSKRWADDTVQRLSDLGFNAVRAPRAH